MKIIPTYLGYYDNSIPEEYFDVVFSISVVEHVEVDSLQDFFNDCTRILKLEGLMLHAIDTYVFDTPNKMLERIELYKKCIKEAGFMWCESPIIDKNLIFKCCYA